MFLLTWWAPQSPAAEEEISTPSVKAAFVVNFASFVEWPASTNLSQNTDLVIGVVGNENHQQAFEFAARQHEGQPRKISVIKLSSPASAAKCQIVFIAADEDVGPVLSEVKDLPVLTMGEGPKFAEHGGMIALVTAGQNIRFDINHAAATAVGLKISSKVLSLARRVINADQKGGP